MERTRVHQMHPRCSSQSSRDSAQQKRAQNTRAREFQAGRERFSRTKRNVSLVAGLSRVDGCRGRERCAIPYDVWCEVHCLFWTYFLCLKLQIWSSSSTKPLCTSVCNIDFSGASKPQVCPKQNKPTCLKPTQRNHPSHSTFTSIPNIA